MIFVREVFYPPLGRGRNNSSAYTLLLILGLSSAVSMTNITGINLVFGISKHKFATILSLCTALTNLILSLILVRHLGLVGVALGTAIPGILTSALILPLYNLPGYFIQPERLLRPHSRPRSWRLPVYIC